MSLWNNVENLAGKPKWLTEKITFDASSADVVSLGDDSITFAGHGYATGDSVVYTNGGGTQITGLTSGVTYFVRRTTADVFTLYDSKVNALAAPSVTGLVNLTGLGVGTVHTFQLDPADVVFVSAEEAQTPANKAKGLTHSGWWRYSTYTDAQANVRHKAECLVAMGTGNVVSGDAEDVITVDPVITINTQPLLQTVTDPAPATFTAAATVDNGGTVTYQWQNDGGVASWVNEVGETAATLVIDPTTGLNGYSYRVVVSSAGAADVTSSAVLLTVNV